MSPDSVGVGVGGNTEGPSSDVPRQCGCGPERTWPIR